MVKIWWLFAQLYKHSTDCFGSKVTTVSRFQNRICNYCKPEENKILYIANEEMGAATVES